MDCKTKNISMFFVHAISFFLLATIFSAHTYADFRLDDNSADGNAGIISKEDAVNTIETEKNALIVPFSEDTHFEDSEMVIFPPVEDFFGGQKTDTNPRASTETEAISPGDKKLVSDEGVYDIPDENIITVEDIDDVSGDKITMEESIHDFSADKLPEEKDYNDNFSGHETPKSPKNFVSSIDVTIDGDDLLVSVLADAPIEKYKTFTIERTDEFPARIVVDMFALATPFDGEKDLPVNLKWAEKVRYSGHEDKVRLVIDTDDRFISEFTTYQVENGLDIRVREPSAEEDKLMTVGVIEDPALMTVEDEMPEKTKKTHEDIDDFIVHAQEPVTEKSIDPQAAQATKLSQGQQEINVSSSEQFSAVVNRIEFTGLPEGESTVLFGTTHPIQYEIVETDDKKIILNLLNTRLPEHRKRPLITTRFDSAVDRVLPMQTESMKDTIVSIELRQMVAYEVEQIDNIVKVHFEASFIPPKPLKDAQLPPWRKVMEETFDLEKMPALSVPSTTPTEKEERASDDSADAMMSVNEIGRLTRPADNYTGEKIALDFFDTDIRNVFRILREVSGKNFAIDRDVTGTVTLTLERPVPWDQVLDLILKMNQLGKVEEGDIVRIARMATITQEEDARRAQIAARELAKQQQIAVEPLITEYISVNYSDARGDILPHLHNIATKERGSLSVDTRTNMIIMTDTADKIRQAREIVQRLDLVTPQVIIEARIVEASSTFSKEIGIRWSTEGGIHNDDPRAGTGPQRGYDFLGGTWGYDTAVNLPPATSAGSIGFQFSRIFGTPLIIDAKLSAMESLGEGKIVSAPKVMTLNNRKAVIKQGREVPYSVVSLEGVNTQFKDVDLLLEVTPHVTPDNRVSLRVKITKDEIAEFTIDGIPTLSTKQAETELLINDGETIVIGGILQTTEQTTTRKVPAVGNIPVLGWLFRAEAQSTRKEELLIFLTPRIMRLEQKNI